MLTIAYMTNRRNPRIQWFFDSLVMQGGRGKCEVVVVDFHKDARDISMYFPKGIDVRWVKPKPTVWQGEHRRTKVDYFAPSSARNTAICLTRTSHIACVDDLSVLMPGWLDTALESIEWKGVTLGSYWKVKNLNVINGMVVSFDPFEAGKDSRWKHGVQDGEVTAAGSWMFGCSFLAPLEDLLKVNGFDEDCDSMGGEDYAAGMMMQMNGVKFRYSRRMWTMESEEAHHEEGSMKRIIKKTHHHKIDASHAILDWVQSGKRRQGAVYNQGGLRALRDHVLKTGEFPVTRIPEHDWRDGQPLEEMD